MKLNEITDFLETVAPLKYQESYDNSGLLVGHPKQEIKSALLCLDVVEEVVDEAIVKGINLIISHHPVIFQGLKKITGKNYIERAIIKAIKNDIAIYAGHTNFDNIYKGVNQKICQKLNLQSTKILSPQNNFLRKLVTFIPVEHIDKVRTAVFKVGAGHIGNYDSCSFNLEGEGTFKGGENTNPFVGEKEKLHKEKEIRFETIFSVHEQSKILKTLFNAHPYEEVAYDIYELKNTNPLVGSGMIGELSEEINSIDFLKKISKIFNSEILRYSHIHKKKIKKIAVCGGSGSFLISKAIEEGADMFITGEIKYHDFFSAENQIIIVDIGHFESEQYTIELFYDLLQKKFPNFAVNFSEIKTNPVNYLTK